MLDHQDGQAVPTVQLGDERRERLDLGGPQPGERLVEQKEARSGGKRTRQLEAAQGPVGERLDGRPPFPFESDEAQDALHTIAKAAAGLLPPAR